VLGSGARREFEAFAAASSTRLLRTAYLLCGDREHAEDLVQVTLLRTARRWHAARAQPEAYTRRVLVNLAKDRWRDLGRRPAEVRLSGTVDFAAAFGEPELRIDRDQLIAALATLSDGQRAVVVLRYFDDLSVDDTAAALRCSAGTVKSQTSRALAALRSALIRSTEPAKGTLDVH
jgi:RNA polymerase sigma-70 factor (sigma-E family)